MAIIKSRIINVLNYNENPVCIKTHLKEYMCEKSDGVSPSITPLEFSEVQSLNSNSPVFKIGILFFSEDEQEEIYEELRILDWKNILNNDDIKKILLHPTLEGLTKIVEIKSVMQFERIRGIYYSLKNTNEYDLSVRLEKVINTRYKELCNRKINSKIQLSKKDTITSVSTDEVDSLKKQNELLQEQMSNMQKMMEKMMDMQTGNSQTEESIKNENVNNEEADTEIPAKKKPGRPKKTQ